MAGQPSREDKLNTCGRVYEHGIYLLGASDDECRVAIE